MNHQNVTIAFSAGTQNDQPNGLCVWNSNFPQVSTVVFCLASGQSKPFVMPLIFPSSYPFHVFGVVKSVGGGRLTAIYFFIFSLRHTLADGVAPRRPIHQKMPHKISFTIDGQNLYVSEFTNRKHWYIVVVRKYIFKPRIRQNKSTEYTQFIHKERRKKNGGK